MMSFEFDERVDDRRVTRRILTRYDKFEGVENICWSDDKDSINVE
jgi:hypothetical protein